MSGVKRYSMDYDYCIDAAPTCTCSVEEDKFGYYVEFSSYMKLLSEYAQFKKEVDDGTYKR